MSSKVKALLAASIVFLVLASGLRDSARADDANLEANKMVAYQAIELWLSGTKVTPEEVMAPDYINHLDSQVGDTSAPRSRGLAAFKEEERRFHAAFSDVKVTAKVQVAQGDLVATHVNLSALHVGSYVDEPPTRKTIYYDSVEFTRIEDGKVVETWVTWDKYALFRQIGLIK